MYLLAFQSIYCGTSTDRERLLLRFHRWNFGVLTMARSRDIMIPDFKVVYKTVENAILRQFTSVNGGSKCLNFWQNVWKMSEKCLKNVWILGKCLKNVWKMSECVKNVWKMSEKNKMSEKCLKNVWNFQTFWKMSEKYLNKKKMSEFLKKYLNNVWIMSEYFSDIIQT